MKKRSVGLTLSRFAAFVLLASMLMFAATGCSPQQNEKNPSRQSDNSSTETDSSISIRTETPYTLFVDNDERSVWYLVDSSWGKDAIVYDTYVCENGQIENYRSSELLSMGMVAKYSDDEIINYLHEEAASSEFGSDPKVTDVTLHLGTDKTGNKVAFEHVAGISSHSIDEDFGNFYYLTSPMNEPLTVYDSQFAGYQIYTTSGYTEYLVTKVDGPTNFALDNLTDYDIPVD